MGLQEEIRVLSDAVDVLSHRRDAFESFGADVGDMTDIIEGILKIMAELSV
jgi:hypothetical protein